MVVTQGILNLTTGPVTFPDRGFSFCNCKNIWFTNWENIDRKGIKHDNEAVEVLHYYLTDLGFIPNTSEEFQTVFVPIINMGYGHNKVLVEGNAPKTKEEFKRLGFIVDDLLGPYNIIWAYHTVEHVQRQLELLKEYYNRLVPGGLVFIAMPDPFFINFDNLLGWGHWLLREHYIMWDMDSFCDEAEKIGFSIACKIRNVKIKVCKDMHLILRK